MCTGKVWKWPTIGSRWRRQDVFRSQTLAESNKGCTRRSFKLDTWRSTRSFLIKVGSLLLDSSPVWKLVSSYQLRKGELLIWCQSLCDSQISYFIINMQFTPNVLFQHHHMLFPRRIGLICPSFLSWGQTPPCQLGWRRPPCTRCPWTWANIWLLTRVRFRTLPLCRWGRSWQHRGQTDCARRSLAAAHL